LFGFVVGFLIACVRPVETARAEPMPWIGAPEPFVNAQWGPQEGLPPGAILDLEESPDGRLWICGAHGLRVFDGKRFLVPEGLEALGDATIQRSAVDTRGHLWFSGAGSVHVFEPLAGGRFRKTTFPGSELVRDGSGWVWWQEGRELRGRCGSLGASMSSGPATPGAPTLLPNLWGARQGGLYRVDEHGHLWRGTLQGWTRIPGPLKPEARVRWCEVFEDPRGRIWMSILTRLGEALLVCRDQGVWRSPFGPNAARIRLAHCFLATSRGEILVGADRGFLYLFSDPHSAPRTHRIDSVTDAIHAIHEDGGGNWWVASEGGELRLIGRDPHALLVGQARVPRDGRVSTVEAGVTHLRRRKSFRVHAVAVDPGGRLWAAAGSLGLRVREGGRLVSPAGLPPALLGGVPVTSIASTPRGLWVGGDRLLMLLDSEGLPRPGHDLSGRLNPGSVVSLAIDSAGVLWAGTDSGDLWSIPADPARAEVLTLGEGPVSDLAPQGDRLWMIVGNRLRCRTREGWVPVPAELEPIGSPRSLFEDGRGRLMVVGASGVAIRERERVVILGPEQGVFPRVGSTGFHDPRSGLWLASGTDLQEIPSAWLDAALSGKPPEAGAGASPDPIGRILPFSTLSEVRLTAQRSGTPVVLPSGEVALPCDKGVLLVRLDSKVVRRDRAEFRFGDMRVEMLGDARGPVPVDPSCIPQGAAVRVPLEGNLAATLQPPLVRYSTSARDDAWIPWNPEQPLRIVARGRDSFPLRVQTRLSEGGWGAEVSSRIDVEPAPGLSGVSREVILAGFPVLLALVGWTFWRVTIQQRRIRIRALEGVQNDRVRIARALHDDLGNRLSEIQLLTEQATFFVGPGQPTMPLVNRIHSRSVEATVALDNMVWLMRDVSEAATDLGRHIERLARDYLRVCSVELDFKLLAGSELEIGGWVRQLIVAATQELTRNAVRHGHATRVSIELRVSADWVSYRLEDDGAGFVVRDALASGRGLSGLADRIEDLGGEVSLVSSPGRSVIVLKVPRIVR
jgi:signal transduction histidine kinase